MPTLPSFAQAADRQYRYGSYYTVWLIAPDGAREYLGFSGRRSGTGLLRFISNRSVQDRVRQFPDAESITCTKTASELKMSNGYRVAFGGTIRQEATA